MSRGVGIALIAWIAVLAAVALPAPAAAAPPNSYAAAAAATDVSAQRRLKRRVPQIRVTPRYPRRNYNSVYPLPYDYDYPGPSAKRACVARLVQEARPSGTVVVPRMRCWWVGG